MIAVAEASRRGAAGAGDADGGRGASGERGVPGDVARRVIRDRREQAAEAGAALAELTSDRAAFAARAATAFAELADPAYRAGQELVAPGIGPTFGVRSPLQTQLRRALHAGSRGTSPSELLLVADRLLRGPERELIWLAISILERTVVAEPERTWQLLRRAGSDASDWITVDSLAHPFGKGILREPYRWAELEQLTISPSRWERRLVGSTIATIPFVDRRAGREPAVAARALAILGLLMGDAEPDVQKALSWAYRSMALVDLRATEAALEAEADRAVADRDGNRAWVVRDSLAKVREPTATRLRHRLVGLRRRAGAPSTSDAAALAARFGGMGLGRAMPEPPLT